jgi:DNA mismatch repair protein MutL
MPIKVLEPELATQIAAGEVVERPVSVVKELVENCLDAGATQITVEIKGGGVEQVRVIDDGEGIPANQVALAFQHHATSKLTHQEQLDSIGTLGFRGEAIPSIAAVSQMTLTTRSRDAGGGQQVQYQWGKKFSESPQGCSPGTAVTVRDLFGNLPARRKFLKSNSAETSRIRELIDRYALAYPEVRFQLTVEGRTSVATPGSGNPAEALLSVYQPDIASGMLRVQADDLESDYGVDGFASAPRLNRANRTYMTFFINRRWIQSRMLSFALEEAYHGLLPERRYPLASLNLTLPYSDVDVNSHPAKREVRFLDESKVYSTLQRAVRAALIADSPVPVLGRSGSDINQLSSANAAASPSFFRSAFDLSGSSGRRSVGSIGSRTNLGSVPLADPGFTPQQALPALRVVGQVRLTYIVAEGPDGMYLLDQHAAHERVLFDRIVRKGSDRSPVSQSLLSPMTVEMTPAQTEVLHTNLAFLASYGFELEPFGENSYLLRAVPSVMTSQNPARSLVDILDMVAFEGLLRQHDDILAASIACHSAIRAGKALTEPEMRALLEELEVTDNPHTCPHGRPTLIHFSEYQMDREFGRR